MWITSNLSWSIFSHVVSWLLWYINGSQCQYFFHLPSNYADLISLLLIHPPWPHQNNITEVQNHLAAPTSDLQPPTETSQQMYPTIPNQSQTASPIQSLPLKAPVSDLLLGETTNPEIPKPASASQPSQLYFTQPHTVQTVAPEGDGQSVHLTGDGAVLRVVSPREAAVA